MLWRPYAHEVVDRLSRTKTILLACGIKTVMLSLCLVDAIVVAVQRYRFAVCRVRARVFSSESLCK